MPNIPSLRKRHAETRGHTSSADINANLEETFFDLVSLFNTALNLSRKLTTTKTLYSIENTFLQSQLLRLAAEADKLQQELDDLKRQDNTYTVQAFVEDFSTTPGPEAALIDLEHGIVTLALSGDHMSKTYIYDEVNDVVIIPKTLTATLTPKADGVSVVDHGVMNAFNGSPHDYWYREISLPVNSPIDSVECTMEIALPDNIISTRNCNTIHIRPFPLGSIDIMSVEYRMNSNWRPIPGWAGPVTNAGNLKLCFADTQIAEVRVKFRQRYWIESNHKKVFYIGAQEIGVFHSNYQVKQSTFDVEFPLPKTGASIDSIKPYLANAEALTDRSSDKRNLVTFDIYTKDPSGELVYVKDTLPANIDNDKVIIKVTLHADPNNGATPALERIELSYRATP